MQRMVAQPRGSLSAKIYHCRRGDLLPVRVRASPEHDSDLDTYSPDELAYQPVRTQVRKFPSARHKRLTAVTGTGSAGAEVICSLMQSIRDCVELRQLAGSSCMSFSFDRAETLVTLVALQLETHSLRNIFSLIDEGDLCLQPKYQR